MILICRTRYNFFSKTSDYNLQKIKLNTFIGNISIINKFDFFSVNFEEELSALDGNILLDQTEYVNDCIKFILNLYEINKTNKVINSFLLK
jgi:hypothetical protein